MTTAYPLQWPPGFTRSREREKGQFSTTLEKALGNVEHSLRLFGSDSKKAVSNIVISSNYALGERTPADPGVAVYFTWDGLQVCIPVDRYATLAANLQAIHHIVEARRVELRHGTLQLVRASFAGFKALPAPTKPWRAVLAMPNDMPATGQNIDQAYRMLAMVRHPDKGGNAADMAELNAARDEALRDAAA